MWVVGPSRIFEVIGGNVGEVSVSHLRRASAATKAAEWRGQSAASPPVTISITHGNENQKDGEESGRIGCSGILEEYSKIRVEGWRRLWNCCRFSDGSAYKALECTGKVGGKGFEIRGRFLRQERKGLRSHGDGFLE